MTKAKLQIDLDKPIFQQDAGVSSTETANILRELADRIDGHHHFSEGHSQSLFDSEGNEVGWFAILPNSN